MSHTLEYPWIEITPSSMPPEGKNVAVWNESYGEDVRCGHWGKTGNGILWIIDGKFSWDAGGVPTHYCLLPKPPKKQN